MTLNSTNLNIMEDDFPFDLTPEQKSILLLWFGADSKFGWSKLDFLVGVHRVRRLYPDHRINLYKGLDGLTSDPDVDYALEYDLSGNTVIRAFEVDDVPF